MRKILFLILIFPVLSCTTRSERASDHLEKGNLFLMSSQYSDALREFDEAIRLDTNLAEAYFKRGSVYFNLRKPELALTDYSHAIDLKPGLADAWFNRGNVWFYLNEKDKACEDWKEALRLGKPNVEDKIRHCP